ncbi:hypothetical protein GCM10025734_75700 [Kitasatospora paranensis]|uniref:hypothetical protein n=1 Tax=Kitasatospora paranensis TaxID=258053 RepID=UPI0031E80EC2
MVPALAVRARQGLAPGGTPSVAVTAAFVVGAARALVPPRWPADSAERGAEPAAGSM